MLREARRQRWGMAHGPRNRRMNRRKKPKRPRKAPTHDHTLPVRLSESALGTVQLKKIPHEEQAIREYVELESDGEKVTHLEKVMTEWLHGRRLDAWDVRTNKDRYWVITDPTNLYSQTDFPSLDYTISFHVGVTTRMMALREPRGSEEQRDRLAGPWRRWTQAAEAFDRADEAEEFQAVGMRCREALLAFIRAADTAEMVPAGQDDNPKRGDFIRWSELIADAVAVGEGAAEIRGYLKSVARSTWQLVNWLTHATNAVRLDAQVAVDATEHALGAFGMALVRHERGAPDRCPVCSSYRITSVYRPALDIDPPYVNLCEACGWSTPEGEHSQSPTTDTNNGVH